MICVTLRALVGLVAVLNVAGSVFRISTELSKVNISGAGLELGSHYVLPELDFNYDALEKVFVGSQTMHLHHDKHHAFYVNTLNAALEKSEAVPMDIETLVKNIHKLPPNLRAVVRNHGGGHMNHALFWKWLKPGGAQAPKGTLKAKILEDFGSFSKFQAAFEAAAATRFGSGWAWLVLQPGKHLKVCSTANQDNPTMEVGNFHDTQQLPIGCRGTPLLGLDVWEHAYYLDFFNLRLKYAKAFWKVVNWDVVDERFAAAMADKKLNEESSERSAAQFSHLCPLGLLLVACQWLL